jgi:hypothetical protein
VLASGHVAAIREDAERREHITMAVSRPIVSARVGNADHGLALVLCQNGGDPEEGRTR